jgi:hypothetical protein
MPASNPRSSRTRFTSSASQILSSVVTVIGLPASICCQCLAENPNEIIDHHQRRRFGAIPPKLLSLGWDATLGHRGPEVRGYYAKGFLSVATEMCGQPKVTCFAGSMPSISKSKITIWTY